MFGFLKLTRRARVLIVDDEPPLVETLKDRLEICNFQVYTASNGKEGLEQAIKCKPDLILLDTMMPVMNGHEMLEIFRQLPEGKDVSVIMVTACSLIDDIDTADKYGVDEYVIKPFSATELIDKIKAVLESKGVLATDK